jgi:hypothetical protein
MILAAILLSFAKADQSLDAAGVNSGVALYCDVSLR